MALIKFTVQLVGGDPATLPVTVTTPLPVSLTQAGGPKNIAFQVENTLGRSVVLDNLSAEVTVGDPALLNIALIDTVLSIGAGATASSAMVVTPNQEILEGMQFEIEVTGAEAA